MLILKNTILPLQISPPERAGNEIAQCDADFWEVSWQTGTRNIAVKGAVSSQRMRTAFTIQVKNTFFLILTYTCRSQLLQEIFQRHPRTGRHFATG